LSTPEHLIERAAAAALAFVSDLDAPVLDPADERHLFSVRRLRDGEAVIAADGSGAWRRCVVRGRSLAVAGEVVVEQAPAILLEVAFAPVKGDRSEWAVAKLTELGVDRIVALDCERAAVRWTAQTAPRALERWRRVAREAACQSRRVRLPEILGPLRVEELAGLPGTALAVPGASPLPEGIHRVLIGPEGGFTERERLAAEREVGLSDGVLRTETAAVAAGVLLGALRGGTVGPVEAGG
jgi:16S rRNA (uracil1498-N3)-methyltransferase